MTEPFTVSQTLRNAPIPQSKSAYEGFLPVVKHDGMPISCVYVGRVLQIRDLSFAATTLDAA